MRKNREMMRNMAHNSRGEVKIVDSHFITANDELYEDDLHLTLIYMGHFDNLFYMGGGGKKPPLV